MVFIPMAAHRTAPPSARALDLSRRLKAEIDKFEREYPGTSAEDLRTAADLAVGPTAPRAMDKRRAVAVAMAGVAALVGLVGVFSARQGAGLEGGAFPLVAVLLVGGLAAGVVAALRRRDR